MQTNYEQTKEKLQAFNFIKKLNKFTTMNTTTNKKFKMSVGKFASQYSTPFDAMKVSLRTCKGDKEKAEQLRSEWKYKGEQSCIKGTIFHSMVEWLYDLRESKDKVVFDLPMKLKKQFHSFYLKNKDRLKPLAIELKVGLPDGRIHGISDMLYYNTQTDKVYLFDWKTNGKMARTGFNNQMLLNEFKAFPDADFYKYSIQIETYRYIIETVAKIKIDGAFIGWFFEDNDTYKVYPVESMKSIISGILTSPEVDLFNNEEF